jgi:hypothetical protein
MAVELATTYVSLALETRNVAGDLARAFQRAGDQRVGIHIDISGVRRDVMQAFARVGDQTVAVDVDASGVRRDVTQAFSRVGDQTVGVDVDASGVRGELSREFDRAGGAAGQSGGQAAGGGIADALSGMGGKGGAIGLALGTAFTLAGVSVGGLFVKALQRGMENEQVLDVTQARLGVDDATMARVGLAAGRSYVDAFGTSVEENIDLARQAIQSGLLDPNATAADMEAVISQISGVNDMIGGDLTETTKAASILLKNGLAANATEAFDIIAAGYRAAGPAGDDLIDSLKEYSSGWANAGLTGEQAIALIGQSIDMGVDSTDRGADALREFGRRVTEEGDTIVETLNGIGLNGTEMYEAFKSGGPEAFAAFDKAFDTIRAIEDPAERNAAAMALLGDTAGDFIGAFAQWDPSAAVDKLGSVAGAAGNALDTMGGNAATSVESAKRNIELSLDQLSNALAHAFGPGIAKLGDWVSTHQPEILGFLGKLVDAGFVAGDAMLAFASTGLNALADFAEGAGSALSGILDPIGLIAQGFGMLTGDDELEGLGETLQGLDDKLGGVADRARWLADGIDERARPALDGMRDSIAGDIGEAQRAAEVMRALGDTVTAIPTEHGITLSDNSPEVVGRLEALGLKVTTLPSGEVVVTANTHEGQTRIDAFMQQNSNHVIPVKISPRMIEAAPGNLTGRLLQQALDEQNGQTVPGRALGGVFRGAGGPTDDANLVRISDREHLAFITRAQATNPSTLPFLDAINNGWVPPPELLHGMVPGFAEGGVAGRRALDYARAHDGEPYVYGGLDCSGYLSEIYGRLTQTASRFTTDSDFSAWGMVPGYDPDGFSIGTNGGSGVNGHMAGTLFGTNVESDGTNGIQFGGSADGAADFPNVWHLPRDLWSPPETDDPSAATAPGALGGNRSGGSGGSGLGSGGAGAGGSAGGAGGGQGVTVNGQTIPAGVTPVWVVNAGGTANITPAPAETVAPSANVQSATTLAAAGPDMNSRALEAGSNFLNANVDSLLGDLGLRRSGGSIQALVSAIYDAMADAAAAEVKRANAQQATSITQFGRR